ncbi:hypothetical protein JKF63_07393 [Porcisia hertigi]|uniref:Uncharacterized protein n=1 Tax=Porcisia hertigi TaxID=2761500 RepID=A0A836LKU5_9TRYP|nr:hypothetical protein JKF63_07393 [Porcisia hertigi]
MGHKHSISAHTFVGGDSVNAALGAVAADVSPHRRSSKSSGLVSQSRWPSRILSAEHKAYLCAELAILLKALAAERLDGEAKHDCPESAGVTVRGHEEEGGDGRTPKTVPRTEPLPQNVSTLLQLKWFEEIHLSGYQLGDAALTSPNPPDLPSFLSVVPQHTRLRILDLSFNRLTPQVVAPLLDAVRGLPLLEVLKLSGNRLGSASAGEDDGGGNLCKWDLSTVNVEKLEDASMAAAQLGRWLATNPPLLELALFHCELNDNDVRAVLAGLVHPRNTRLRSLQLAWNPACTSHSARMALQLVTDLGNTTLCELELEGAAPATQKRLEYACTPDGTFRSGRTLIPASAGGAAAAAAAVAAADATGCSDNRDKTSVTSSHVTDVGAVELEQLRQQQQRLATMQTHLTLSQAARNGSRCRFLDKDFDGMRVLPPLIMRELAAVLSTRSRLQSRVTEPRGVSEQMDTPNPTGEEVSPPSRAGTEEDKPNGSELLHTPTKGEEPGSSDGHEDRAAASPLTSTVANSATGVLLPSIEPAAAMTESNGIQFSPPPHAPGTRRPRTSPPTHLHAGQRASASRRNRYPQETRDARLEKPQRIAAVMADADAFRRRLHPLQVDTFAPPCADVSRHRRCPRSASSANGRAAWYTVENFVLRANGLTNVLVAPVRHGSAAPYNHVVLDDVHDRSILPCWCTPRQTTASTGIFAGTLHYHCVHEATAQQEKQQYGTTSPSVAKPATSAKSKSQLPMLRPLTARHQQEPNTPLPEEIEKIYCGCKGTHHLCISERVASDEAHTGRHRSRMRAMLLAKADKFVDKPVVKGCGAAWPRKAADCIGAAITESDGGDNTVGTVTTPGPPMVYMRTVHTKCGPLSVALNYNPVTHFSAPHVGCASDLTLAEL